MRLTVLLLVMVIFSSNIFGQDTTFSQDTTSSQDTVLSQEAEEHNELDVKSDTGIIFTCNTLEPESKATDFSVSGDTISFKVYYIDFECDEYLYEFERQGPVLIVRRIPKPSGTCDKNFDVVYAFEGSMINVPPGRFQFQLESKYADSKSVIFREVLDVKK